MCKLIALYSAEQRSGKNTLINQLEKEGYKVKVLSFGSALKEALANTIGGTQHQLAMTYCTLPHLKEKEVDRWAIIGLPESSYKNWLLYNKGYHGLSKRSMRWHMQQFGTDFVRGHWEKPTYWLDKLQEQLRDIKPEDYDFIFVDDMRFMNEYQMLLSEGFTMVEVKRDWEDVQLDKSTLNHKSNNGLQGVIFNICLNNRKDNPKEMTKQFLGWLHEGKAIHCDIERSGGIF